MDTAGFVLVDSQFRPIYANPESIKILGYPNAIRNPASMDLILTQKILSFLPGDLNPSHGSSFLQFQSGKRRYLCRAFVLEDHWNSDARETRIGLLLERGLPGPPGTAKSQRKLAGMSEDAFSFAPDPRFYYFSRGHQEVYGAIRSLIRERRGIGTVLAQAGMGKTALLEYMAKTLGPESEIALVPGSFDSRVELVQGVMGILGLKSRGRHLEENLLHFENWLDTKRQAGRLVTLICDDAHDLSTDALESLCLFSGMQSGRQKLLQIVVAGRQGLLEKLNGLPPEIAGNNITLVSRLAPMDETEVRGYILHRLRIAGCTRQPFTTDALSSIALHSRGVPLNINMICRHAMSLAASINMSTIDDRIVADSAYDLVLRAQPAGFWDNQLSGGSTAKRPADTVRDRRGLHLVQKTTS